MMQLVRVDNSHVVAEGQMAIIEVAAKDRTDLPYYTSCTDPYASRGTSTKIEVCRFYRVVDVNRQSAHAQLPSLHPACLLQKSLSALVMEAVEDTPLCIDIINIVAEVVLDNALQSFLLTKGACGPSGE